MKKHIHILFIVFVLFAVYSCARVVVPKGGEKDIEPPRMVKSTPISNSTSFNAKEIKIDFDEYITLESASEKLIISPPLKNKPDISYKLKTLYIKGLDSLQENTTYIFDFSDAIRDFNEGNAISNFVFSFSTGKEIDTMTYYGRLLNAYTLKTEKNKYVALYSSDDKQIQISQIPNYITRSDSVGRFFFHNIKQGEYSLIAYEDNNNNLLYDLVTESIAFASQRIEAKKNNDSLFRGDTLYMTTAKDSVMKLLEAKFLSEKEISLSFSLPVSDSLQIIFQKPQTNNFIINKDITDTSSQISVYIAESGEFDSVSLKITDKNFVEETELAYNQKRKNKNKTFAFSLPNNELAFYDSLTLNIPFPIDKTILPIKAEIKTETDSVFIDFYSKHNNDKQLISNYKLRENQKYSIVIDSNIVNNLRGETNEKFTANFSTDKANDYSKLIFHIEDSLLKNKQIIYTLFDEKNVQVGSNIVTFDSVLIFDYLKEGKYKLRAIIDENKNGKWDGNDFYLHKQAEKVLFFPKPINVRKSWDVEEVW